MRFHAVQSFVPLCLLLIVLALGCTGPGTEKSEPLRGKRSPVSNDDPQFSQDQTLDAEAAEPAVMPTPVTKEFRPNRRIIEEDMLAIVEHFWGMMADPARKKVLASIRRETWAGAMLFGKGVQNGMFDRELVLLLAMPGGLDSKAAPDKVVDVGEVPAECCSYCTPPANSLLLSFGCRGRDRRVVLCPDSDHWLLFSGEVPLFFSDAEEVQWTAWQDLEEDYGITAEEWADPAGKLFGKKAPFQFTYE
jgi:hypothetical protein